MNGPTSIADAWVCVEALPLPSLSSDQVQLWRVDLPVPDTPPQGYIHLLADEEQARAQRLRQGRVRLQFVIARACLRVLLGHALGVDPMLVPILPSSFGKPETPGIFYNVAHSGAAVLIALCRNHAVGVDVEYVTREVDALEIAKNSFAAAEYSALSSIDDAASLRRAFFRCWTRKEAVIKADGRGLSLPLDSFEVPAEDVAKNAPVLIPAHDSSPAHTCFVSDITIAEGVAAAYATAAPDIAIERFSLGVKMMLQMFCP